jgi:hypothetical protein
MAKRLGDNDLKAIMQFVLLSCVILPVLPNENYLLGVLNPREIWLMVVLIVGISLFGYIAYKYFGRDAGIILGGCLGGAISSTATTVSHARRTSVGECDARVASLVILIASTVVFVRILLLVAVVAPALLATLSPPVLATMLLMLLPAMILWLRMRGESNPMPEQKNPTQLKAALMFAALYAMVQLALALVRDHVGRQGLYGVAVLYGERDLDRHGSLAAYSVRRALQPLFQTDHDRGCRNQRPAATGRSAVRIAVFRRPGNPLLLAMISRSALKRAADEHGPSSEARCRTHSSVKIRDCPWPPPWLPLRGVLRHVGQFQIIQINLARNVGVAHKAQPLYRAPFGRSKRQVGEFPRAAVVRRNRQFPSILGTRPDAGDQFKMHPCVGRHFDEVLAACRQPTALHPETRPDAVGLSIVAPFMEEDRFAADPQVETASRHTLGVVRAEHEMRVVGNRQTGHIVQFQ